VFILLGGLTLLPALFVLFGRKSFWPYIPKVGSEATQKKGFWHKFAATVIKRPGLLGSFIFTLMLLVSLNVTTNEYSFNLIKSFPEDMESRVGFELLEDNFAPGELAMTTLIVESDEPLDVSELVTFREHLLKKEGVANVTPDLSDENIVNFGKAMWLNEAETVAKLSIVFDGNPYDIETMEYLNSLRANQAEKLIDEANLTDIELFFAVENAKNVDTRTLNLRC